MFFSPFFFFSLWVTTSTTSHQYPMLSFGEIVVIGVGLVVLLGRKEGLRMVQQSGRTLGKFWKEMAKDKPTLKGPPPISTATKDSASKVTKDGGSGKTTKD